MARFSGGTGSGSGSGAPGPQGQRGPTGPTGANGAQGPTGPVGETGPLPFNYLGDFDYGVTYAGNDAVTFDGGLWKLNNTIGAAGYAPTPGQWTLIIPAGTAGANGADGADGSDGSPGLVYLGDYVSGNGYIANLAVVKGSDNNLYIATSSGGLGDPVGNTAEWAMFLPKGADGADGTNGTSLTVRGAWTDSENYAINDIVNFEGSSYVCIVGVTAGTDVAPYPQHIGAYWQLLAQGGSGSADIADFVFTNVDASNSSMTITGDKEMTIESGADSDLNVRAGDQLWLTAGNDVILQADDTVQLRSTDSTEILSNYVDMGNAEHRWEFNPAGRFVLPGEGYITNPINSSGDGYGLGTIELVPDGTITSDQYLIIDPTSPNHIHIRAGGQQDNSSAHLYLGAERNNIEVSDPYKTVKISTKPQGIQNTYGNSNQASNTEFMVVSDTDIIVGDEVRLYTGGPTYIVTAVTPEYPYEGLMTVVADGLSFVTGESYTFTRTSPYNNSWTFGDGTLSFSNGTVIETPANEGTVAIYAATAATENGGYVEIGGGNAVGDNKTGGTVNILGGSANGSNSTGGNVVLETTNSGKILLTGNGGEFLNNMAVPENQIATIGDIDNTVSNVMVRYSPVFTATGLAFTGSGATYPTYNSYYAKSGKMVSFVIEVDLSTVTNFGTGQYKVQLPFTPAFGFNHFSGWCWADPDVSPDVGTGHTIINADTAGVTDVLDLHYLKSAGGANAPIREGLFVQGTPVTMTTISKIYINGTYIAA